MNQIELLKGLTGQGVSLNTRSLARYTADNGVLCEIHIGRNRGHFSLPTKLMGLRVDKWSEESQDFFGNHIKMGHLTVIPREDEKKLNALDGRARALLTEYSVNGCYVPLAVFQEFKQKFEDIRSEYLQMVNEVSESWDEIREKFITGATAMVEARGKRTVLKRDRDAIIKKLEKDIPTAATYRKSAYMQMEVRAFPTTAVTTEGLAPDVEDALNATWRDDVVYNAIKGIETLLGEIFVQVCRTARIYVNAGRMDPRSVSSLNLVANRVKKMNVFSNPILTNLGTRLSNITDLSEEEISERVEEAILDTVEYAKKTGVHLDMKESPFSETQLEDMLKVRTALAQSA